MLITGAEKLERMRDGREVPALHVVDETDPSVLISTVKTLATSSI